MQPTQNSRQEAFTLLYYFTKTKILQILFSFLRAAWVNTEDGIKNFDLDRKKLE